MHLKIWSHTILWFSKPFFLFLQAETNNTTKLRQCNYDRKYLRRRQEVSKGFRHKCFTDVQGMKPQSLIKQTFSGSL